MIWRERDVNYEFGAKQQDIALSILNKMNTKAKQKTVKQAKMQNKVWKLCFNSNPCIYAFK